MTHSPNSKPTTAIAHSVPGPNFNSTTRLAFVNRNRVANFAEAAHKAKDKTFALKTSLKIIKNKNKNENNKVQSIRITTTTTTNNRALYIVQRNHNTVAENLINFVSYNLLWPVEQKQIKIQNSAAGGTLKRAKRQLDTGTAGTLDTVQVDRCTGAN